MTKLKSIAAVSAIIFAVSLLLCLIVLPFALRSGISSYNQLVDKSETYADKLYTDTTLELSVSTLRLADFPYSNRCRIQQSPDDRIHILTLDSGFSYILPEVTQRGDIALLSFRWLDDMHLSEENFLRAIAARNKEDSTIIQLPPSAKLELGELDNWIYYHLDLEYTGFANADEVQQQLDEWFRQEQLSQQARDLRYDLDYLQQRVLELRQELSNGAADWSRQPEYFFADYSYNSSYSEIAVKRNELIQKAYDFLSEHGDLSPEQLEASLNQAQKLIDQLFAQEQELDRLVLQQSYDRFQLELLADGVELSDPEYMGLGEEELQLRLLDETRQSQQLELLVNQLSRQLNTVIQRCLELRDPFPDTVPPAEDVPSAPAAPESPAEPVQQVPA